MFLRIINKSREKLSVVCILAVTTAIITYFYLIYLQNNYKNVQWNRERCASELKSVRYQLNVITEYKNRIDKLLTETQKAHEADKEKLKDIMESCVAMKQSSSLCQSQFEDLQVECIKAKEGYKKLSKDLEKLKNQDNRYLKNV